MIQQLDATHEFDVCIIGGGATGLGIAVDAASRGCKTILQKEHHHEVQNWYMAAYAIYNREI